MRAPAIVRPGSRFALLFVVVAGLVAPLAHADAAPKRLPDLEVVSDPTLVAGVPATVDVAVRAAPSLLDSDPIASATVTASLVKASATPRARQAKRRVVASGTTDAAGRVTLSFVTPTKLRSDAWRLEVRAETPHGPVEVGHDVTITDQAVLHLRTDRTVYKPGDTIYWRSVVARGPNAHPVTEQRVTLTIRNPAGVQIWRGEPRTDDRGMLAGSLPLDTQITTGSYEVTARTLGEAASVSVDIKRFDLPAFFATLELPPPSALAPGAEVSAALVARYPYGAPVQGAAIVTVRNNGSLLARVDRQLDEGGRLRIPAVRLGAGLGGELVISADVTDGAGRMQSVVETRRYGASELHLTAIPERRGLVPGVEQHFTVVTTDEHGELVPAKLEVTVAPGRVVSAASDGTLSSPGALRIPVVVPPRTSERVTVTDATLSHLDVRFSKAPAAELTRLAKAIEDRLPQIAETLDSLGQRLRVRLAAEYRKGDWHITRLVQSPFADRPEFVTPVPAKLHTWVARRLPVPHTGRGAKVSLAWSTSPRHKVVEHTTDTLSLSIVATTADGRQATWSDSVSVTPSHRASDDGGPADAEPVDVEPAVNVRADEAVVAPGQPIVVRGGWPASDRRVVATLSVDGAPISSSVADRAGDTVVARLLPPPGAFGLATVRLQAVGWSKAWHQRHGASATTVQVYLRPARLDIELDVPARVRPGADIAIGVGVTDETGAPRAGVGLAASVTDERVLALSKVQEALPAVLTKGDLEMTRQLGMGFAALLAKSNPSPAELLVLRGVVEAIPLPEPRAVLTQTGATRFAEETRRLRAALGPMIDGLTAHPGAALVGGPDWRLAKPLAAVLSGQGWKIGAVHDPWARPVTLTYLQVLHPHVTADWLGERITDQRLEALAAWARRRAGKVRAHVRARGKALVDLLASRPDLAVDAWGRAWRVEPGDSERGMNVYSAGADGEHGTGDDSWVSDVLHEVAGLYGHGGLGAKAYGRGMGVLAGRSRNSSVRVGHATLASVRKSFADTVLWAVGVRTGRDGRASLEAKMADSVTGWRVEVEALGANGSFGSATTRLETFLPVYVEATPPAALAVGDRYVIGGVVANHRAHPLDLRVTVSAGELLRVEPSGREKTLTLAAGETAALSIPVQAVAPGDATLRLQLETVAGESLDVLERKVRIEPPGSLRQLVSTSFIDDTGSAALRFEIPSDAAPGSVEGRVRVYRDASDEVLDGLEGMLREPYGCFEQTSSTTYPNLLVLDLLKGRKGMGEVRKRAKELVGKGYQRLVGYEVDGGGFSWFGEAPADVILTAYGLLEFSDMSAVYPVDGSMVKRTARWLIEKQRRDGSWQASGRFGGRDMSAAATAYVTWALSEAGWGKRAVKGGLRWLRGHAKAFAEDAYAAALWAAAERSGAGSAKRAEAALMAHAKHTEARFVVGGRGGRTLFYGSGRAAQIEATAIAALALTGDARAQASRRWLWDARDPRFGWGTTQATVMALRAAAKSAAARPKEGATGTLSVRLDDVLAVGEAALGGVEVPTLTLPRAGALAPGKHQLALASDDAAAAGMAAEVRVSWRATGDAEPVSKGLVVHLDVPSEDVRVGGRVALRVGVMNPGNEAVAMPTLVIPVPPGFTPRRETLQALVRQTPVARFEDVGDAIHLYLTELKPGAALVLPYELQAKTVCEVLQRPARAYAYYDPAIQGSSAAAKLRVVADREVARR